MKIVKGLVVKKGLMQLRLRSDWKMLPMRTPMNFSMPMHCPRCKKIHLTDDGFCEHCLENLMHFWMDTKRTHTIEN